MARPREFALDKAVTKAMHVFWQNGYRGTSLPDLLDGMGLTRGSLYKAFGSKRNLFYRALITYENLYITPLINHLINANGDGGQRIVHVFEETLEAVDQGETRGCLWCNILAEDDKSDDEITHTLQTIRENLTKAFRKALSEEPVAAELGTLVLDEEAANLTQNYVGLRILARGVEDAPPLRQSIEARLRQLRR